MFEQNDGVNAVVESSSLGVFELFGVVCTPKVKLFVCIVENVGE
jgi:hypothetical protein